MKVGMSSDFLLDFIYVIFLIYIHCEPFPIRWTVTLFAWMIQNNDGYGPYHVWLVCQFRAISRFSNTLYCSKIIIILIEWHTVNAGPFDWIFATRDAYIRTCSRQNIKPCFLRFSVDVSRNTSCYIESELFSLCGWTADQVPTCIACTISIVVYSDVSVKKPKTTTLLEAVVYPPGPRWPLRRPKTNGKSSSKNKRPRHRTTSCRRWDRSCSSGRRWKVTRWPTWCKKPSSTFWNTVSKGGMATHVIRNLRFSHQVDDYRRRIY